MSRMPLRLWPSRAAHHVVNWLAWKISPDGNRDNSLLWRLNYKVCGPWVDWYIKDKTGKSREDWSKL